MISFLVITYFVSLCFAQYGGAGYGGPNNNYANYAGYIPPQNSYGGGYGAGVATVPISTANIVNSKSVGDSQLSQANTGYTSANQGLNYNAAISNEANSELATCAAFVCVEFDDSTAYGSNTVNTYSGQQQNAATQQGAGSFANQVQQATYNYPQTFSAFNLYGAFPTGGSATAVGSAFPFYGASGTDTNNAFAYGNSAANQATTQHNDYFNDNHAYRATGKKCSKYVCTHSVDQAATEQIGPNYNVHNAYAAAQNQYGPNFQNNYANVNKAATVTTVPYI